MEKVIKGETLAEKIERARGLASKLSDTTDAVNAALTRGETALAKMRLGVTAGVDITSAEAADEGAYEEIRFAKHDGSWHLVHAWGGVFDVAERSELVLKASKEIRFIAAKRLPELVDALIEAAEAQLVEATSSIQAIDDLVRRIEV